MLLLRTLPPIIGAAESLVINSYRKYYELVKDFSFYMKILLIIVDLFDLVLVLVVSIFRNFDKFYI